MGLTITEIYFFIFSSIMLLFFIFPYLKINNKPEVSLAYKIFYAFGFSSIIILCGVTIFISHSISSWIDVTLFYLLEIPFFLIMFQDLTSFPLRVFLVVGTFCLLFYFCAILTCVNLFFYGENLSHNLLILIGFIIGMGPFWVLTNRAYEEEETKHPTHKKAELFRVALWTAGTSLSVGGIFGLISPENAWFHPYLIIPMLIIGIILSVYAFIYLKMFKQL